MKYRVEEIEYHTWLIEEYDELASVYMYLLSGEKNAVLIDTGFGAVPLQKICSSLTDLPVSVLLTHGHADHIGGTGAFENVWLSYTDREVYSSHSRMEIRRIFTKECLYPVSRNLSFFSEKMKFELGGRTLQVIKTPGHTVGSVCFLDEKTGMIFTGDTCCHAHVLLQLEYAAPLEIYRDSIQLLWNMREQYHFIWPGHHKKPVEKRILRYFIEAADGILNGTMEGTLTKLPMGVARLLEYKDIGIEY